MGYNPGATDTSGQILANYTAKAGENRANTIQSVMSQWGQNEAERQHNTALIQSQIAANPVVQQAIQQNPEMSTLLTKATSGKASVQDTRAILGFVTGTTAAQQASQQRALQNAQIQQSQAQAADYQSQAQQRAIQNMVLTRNMNIMSQVFNSQNPDAPLGNEQPKSPQQAQADSGFVPTAPEPTRKGTFFNIIQSTGQMPDPKTVDDAYKASYDKWATVEVPVGYVQGGQETDKDGNRLQNYFPVTRKNDGTTKQATEPVKMYVGTPPPGSIVDPTNGFKPIPQQQQTPLDSLPLPHPVLSGEAKKEIADISNDIMVAKQSLQTLDSMNGINGDMAKQSYDKLSGAMGVRGDTFNAYEKTLGNDPLGQLFNTTGAKFKSDVMSSARNIRNVYEFKAVTGNVPTADLSPENRQKLLNDMKVRLTQNLVRNQKALELMQKGATPDSAWAAATDEATKQTVSEPKKDASVSSTIKKGMTGKTKNGIPVIFDGAKWVPQDTIQQTPNGNQ